MALIMIVDDAQSNIDILRLVLEEKYSLCFAKNGEKALQLMKKRKPDLILLDIMMPVMNGYEVIQTMKADEQLKSIPVIFITAQSMLHEKTKGFELGAVDYITKPFEAVEVRARVDVHLNLLEAKREVEGLLSKTLIGAVGIFLELEKNLHPLVYSFSHKVKNTSLAVAKEIGLTDLWVVEISGLLSQMGMIYMNPVSAENIMNGKYVGSKDLSTYKSYPQYGSDLISKIPRLEPISEVIKLLGTDVGLMGFDKTDLVVTSAQIIKSVVFYELEIGKGMDSKYVLSQMQKHPESYNLEVIKVLEKLKD